MRGFNKRASNLLANLKTDESALAKFASVASQQLDDLTHVSCSTSCAQRMLMLLDASLWRSWRPPADCCVNGRLGCKMFSSDRFMSGSPDVLRCSVAFFSLRAYIFMTNSTSTCTKSKARQIVCARTLTTHQLFFVSH